MSKILLPAALAISAFLSACMIEKPLYDKPYEPAPMEPGSEEEALAYESTANMLAECGAVWQFAASYVADRDTATADLLTRQADESRFQAARHYRKMAIERGYQLGWDEAFGHVNSAASRQMTMLTDGYVERGVETIVDAITGCGAAAGLAPGSVAAIASSIQASNVDGSAQ